MRENVGYLIDRDNPLKGFLDVLVLFTIVIFLGLFGKGTGLIFALYPCMFRSFSSNYELSLFFFFFFFFFAVGVLFENYFGSAYYNSIFQNKVQLEMLEACAVLGGIAFLFLAGTR
jgi:hypothetical protein